MNKFPNESNIHSIDLWRDVHSEEEFVEFVVKSLQKIVLDARQFSHDHIRWWKVLEAGEGLDVQHTVPLETITRPHGSSHVQSQKVMTVSGKASGKANKSKVSDSQLRGKR